MALISAAAPAGSVTFDVSSSDISKQCLPSQQARAAFPNYGRQPSEVSVPALQRSFTVSAGWSSDRFRLGPGWPLLVAATALQPGDRVRLARTGNASFVLVDLGANAVGQSARQAAADNRQGALTVVLWNHPAVTPLLMESYS